MHSDDHWQFRVRYPTEKPASCLYTQKGMVAKRFNSVMCPCLKHSLHKPIKFYSRSCYQFGNLRGSPEKTLSHNLMALSGANRGKQISSTSLQCRIGF